MPTILNPTTLPNYFSLVDNYYEGIIFYGVCVLLSAIFFDLMKEEDFATRIMFTCLAMTFISLIWYVIGFTQRHEVWQVYAIFGAAFYSYKQVIKW